MRLTFKLSIDNYFNEINSEMSKTAGLHQSPAVVGILSASQVVVVFVLRYYL